MKNQFEATLTGTDSTIDGVANPVSTTGYTEAYEFKSLDETLHLVIAKDNDGEWIRIDGTEPYLSSWVDELVAQAV